MRKNESKNVKEALENLGIKLHIVNAKDYFYNSTSEIQGKKTLPLSLIVNPEEKRKIIGDTFIKVAEKEINKLGLNLNDIFLAQGTLRPDLIESASQLVSLKANTIKTHHNDTKLVRDLREQGKIIEPLKDYHKDEVRELGIKLGLPYHIVWRQPFPGPGLAIRIICAEKPFIDSTFEETNNILQLIIHYLSNIISNDEENDFFMKKMNFYNLDNIKIILNDLKTNISNPIHNNIYATLLPIQTVGVQGDGRTYSYIAALSGTKHWNDLFTLSKIIPKVNISEYLSIIIM
jgi:GMP synthase (glutamine-hydrolysing)